MSFTTFLALKYLKPKRSVASAIACVSVIGVMLGVAAVAATILLVTVGWLIIRKIVKIDV